MAGPWVIESEPSTNYGCLNNAMQKAKRWAQKENRPILVEYRGPRDQGKTRDPARVNFTIDGHACRRYVDPQWWENP